MQTNSKNSEALLWDDFLNGNPNAISKIYLNNVKAMYDFGSKFTVDRNLVKDCIQDVFIILIQTRTKLSKTDHVKGYLLKSLKRKIIRESVKKHKFEEIVEIGDYRFEIEFENLKQFENENDNHSIRTFAVRSAIESLTSRQKEALYLRFNLGLSHHEIADVLHLSDQSSRALISRTLQKIRNVIHTDNKKIHNILFLIFSHK